MTTSGTYTFSVTRDQIIRQAMLNIGALYEGETPSAQEVSDCALVLNMMCKQWQAKQDFAPGLKVWTRSRGELYLSNATGQYNLGAAATGWGATHNQTTTTATVAAAGTTVPIASATGWTSGDYCGVVQDSGVIFWTTATIAGTTLTLASGLTSQATAGAYVFNFTTRPVRPEVIETAVLRNVYYSDIPLDLMTLQDYEFMPTKASNSYTGDPRAIYYEYRLDGSSSGVLYTDVGAASDTTKHIHLVYLSPIQDFTTASDNPQYPQGYYMALAWGLAEQIVTMFNKPWTQQHAINAGKAIGMAQEAFGETSSLYFEPGNDGRIRR